MRKYIEYAKGFLEEETTEKRGAILLGLILSFVVGVVLF